MKLLFDQNLSFKLCHQLKDMFPASSQVRLVGLETADDRGIWQFAAAEALCWCRWIRTSPSWQP